MNRLQLGERGCQFVLETFGASEVAESPMCSHLLGHFLVTSSFEIALKDFQPVERAKKVVVVDGHPRAGKSWEFEVLSSGAERS